MLNGIEPMTLLRIVTEAAPRKMIRNCVLTILTMLRKGRVRSGTRCVVPSPGLPLD